MIKRTLVTGTVTSIFIVGQVLAQSTDKQDLEVARKEYDASSHDEAARLRYVSKLAQIREHQLKQYWQGEQTPESDEAAEEVNSELRKHPAPANSDAKKLSRLLVGSWQSPRRVYIFRANGKWGSEDGSVSNNWRISGNQLLGCGTIILIDRDYLIYSDKDAVFFHLRVKE
jgi:hypothetical protein